MANITAEPPLTKVVPNRMGTYFAQAKGMAWFVLLLSLLSIIFAPIGFVAFGFGLWNTLLRGGDARPKPSRWLWVMFTFILSCAACCYSFFYMFSIAYYS